MIRRNYLQSKRASQARPVSKISSEFLSKANADEPQTKSISSKQNTFSQHFEPTSTYNKGQYGSKGLGHLRQSDRINLSACENSRNNPLADLNKQFQLLSSKHKDTFKRQTESNSRAESVEKGSVGRNYSYSVQKKSTAQEVKVNEFLESTINRDSKSKTSGLIGKRPSRSYLEESAQELSFEGGAQIHLNANYGKYSSESVTGLRRNYSYDKDTIAENNIERNQDRQHRRDKEKRDQRSFRSINIGKISPSTSKQQYVNNNNKCYGNQSRMNYTAQDEELLQKYSSQKQPNQKSTRNEAEELQPIKGEDTPRQSKQQSQQPRPSCRYNQRAYSQGRSRSTLKHEQERKGKIQLCQSSNRFSDDSRELQKLVCDNRMIPLFGSNSSPVVFEQRNTKAAKSTNHQGAVGSKDDCNLSTIRDYSEEPKIGKSAQKQNSNGIPEKKHTPTKEAMNFSAMENKPDLKNKLKMIGEFNEKINQRIKHIIENFEHIREKL